MQDEQAPAAIATKPDPDPEAEVKRLAGLSAIEYDRVRKAEAEALSVRPQTLDKLVSDARKEVKVESALTLADPEPWPDPVDGAELLDELAQTVRKHVVLSDAARDAVALWVLHSHAHDSADISPLLAVTSPTPECGKTTLAVTLMGALVPRSLPVSNITSAALFRAVEKWQPTLLIDEADTYLRDSDELRGIINSGHTRAGAFVVRTVGDDHEPGMFRTWSPKVIAAIGKLAPTLASRSIHIELRRLSADESVAPLRGDRVAHLDPVRQRCWRWAMDHTDELLETDPVLPESLRGRTADNWRHLIALADVAGGEWPQRARDAAVTLSAKRSEQTAAVMLLEDVQKLLADTDKMSSQDIVKALVEMDDRPWPEWKQGKPITQRQLARLLEPFEIAPKTIRIGASTAKGYRRDWFEDAFSRYLTSQSVTPSQRSENAGFSDVSSVTPESPVTDRIGPEAAKNGACDGVTDQNPQSKGSTWELTL